MISQPKLTLYLPVGLISSEKLLTLSSFLVPDQLAIEFIYDTLLMTIPDKSIHSHISDANIANMSFDSSDGRNSIESGLRGSLSSSLEFTVKIKKSQRDEKHKKSEFDRNQNLNKVLDRQKLGKTNRYDEELDETEIQTIKCQKPVLKTSKDTYIVNFTSIVLTILKHCTVKDTKLHIDESEITKFRNYMLYIDRRIDTNVNKILYEVYHASKTKRHAQYNRIDKLLKSLLQDLDYFESFVFVKDNYIFGEEFSVVDLMLFGSVARMFVLFFDERIREGCLNNTTKWLKCFIEMEEIRSVYGDFQFCVKSYLSLLENTSEKHHKHSKLIDKKYDQEFNLDNLRSCLKRLVKLRSIRSTNERNKKFDAKSSLTMDNESCKSTHTRNHVSSIDIYKDCDKILDLDTMIRKIEETVLHNINPDEYSVWLFDYIKENDDQAHYEDEDTSQSIEGQLDRFYQDMLVDLENNENAVVAYMAVYSNCEELNKEEEFIGDFEICKDHSPNLFFNRNLKGVIVKKGLNALKFMTSYESLDQIILTKVQSKEEVFVLKDFVNNRGIFAMEKIYKEVAI